MMKKYMNQEIIYGLKSKVYYIFIALLSFMFAGILYYNFTAVENTYEKYQYYINYYKDNDLDVEAALNDTYKVQKDDSGGMTIDNPLLYSKTLLEKYIYASSPKYALSQMLESSIILFPIIFFLFGSITATTDFKYNTNKLKTVRINKQKLNLLKQISLFLASLIIIIISLIIGLLTSFILYGILANEIPLENFNISNTPANTALGYKLIYGFVIAIVFSELGYTLGYIFKNIVVGFCGITIYEFILPLLGKYDLKNIWYYLGKRIFTYCGCIRIIDPLKINIFKSVIIIVFTLVINSTFPA